MHTIATGLTRDGIPSPSGHDAARNPHRASGRGAWSKTAIRAILSNPRCTGYEVWNKQRKDEVLIDVDDVALGHQTKMRWNDRGEWIWSYEPVHEAIVTTQTFEAARAMFGTPKSRPPKAPLPGRQYLLAGMVRCGSCGRRMQGHWHHDRAYYRCRFTAEYGIELPDHPRSLYVQEAKITPGLDGWIGTLFDAEHIDRTAAVLAGHSDAAMPSPDRDAELRGQIADCDRRIKQYRDALDAGGPVLTLAKWMREVEQERKTYETQLGRTVAGEKLTNSQTRALIDALGDIVAALADADPNDKAELYRELGVNLTYHHDGRVDVEVLPRGQKVRVGGGT